MTTRPKHTKPRRALVHYESWAGRNTVGATIERETPTCYACRFDHAIPGRSTDRTYLVPKHAVTMEEQP